MSKFLCTPVCEAVRMSSLLVDHSNFATGPDRPSKTRSTWGGPDKHEQIETEPSADPSANVDRDL